MMKYFISYTTRDEEITKDLLLSFAEHLKLFGEVFIDLIDNNSFNRQERVINELDCSDVVILIDSKSVYQSEWVQIELNRAKMKNLPLIKLTVDDVVSISNSDAKRKQLLHVIYTVAEPT